MSTDQPPLIFRNIRSRLIALLLAGVTWYVVYGAISHEHEVSDIPITFSLSPGWAILDRSADSVTIRFRGSREDIRSLETQAIQVIVDVRDRETAGEKVLQIQPQDVKAPGGARPLRIRPDQVELRLDRDVEKNVPVKANLEGELPPGVEMESVAVKPAAALLSGPATLLDRVDEVRTEPLDLEDRFESFENRVSLLNPDVGGNIRVEPTRVTLVMNLIERKADVTKEAVPIRLLLRPGIRLPAVRVEPSVVDVSFSGDPEYVHALQKELLLAYVDCTQVESGAEYELPVRIHAPERVSVTGINPPVVMLEVGVPDS